MNDINFVMVLTSI